MQTASSSEPDISVALWVTGLEMKKWIMDWLKLQRMGQQRIYEDQISQVKKNRCWVHLALTFSYEEAAFGKLNGRVDLCSVDTITINL